MALGADWVIKTPKKQNATTEHKYKQKEIIVNLNNALVTFSVVLKWATEISTNNVKFPFFIDSFTQPIDQKTFSWVNAAQQQPVN